MKGLQNMKEKCLKITVAVLAVALCLAMKRMIKLLYRGKETIENLSSEAGRLGSYYLLLDHWLNMKYGKSVGDYLAGKGFCRIAVYGMGKLGCLLCNELRNHPDVQVSYGMDKDVITKKRKGVEDLLAVDAVIVTPIVSFGAIRKNLENKYSCPILSLEDIVYRL